MILPYVKSSAKLATHFGSIAKLCPMPKTAKLLNLMMYAKSSKRKCDRYISNIRTHPYSNCFYIWIQLTRSIPPKPRSPLLPKSNSDRHHKTQNRDRHFKKTKQRSPYLKLQLPFLTFLQLHLQLYLNHNPFVIRAKIWETY